MAQHPLYRTAIEKLLNDSPITREDVVRNVREFLMVGEYGLAFDTMCSWIYEDDLEIPSSYHDRLRELADDMDAVEIVEKLRENIHGG
ncbi:MafI family immunity protein [Streptomyces sp. IMTB 1903]|uniref:MafI family immunity protein n=1 Tax=Streptomyces sp. IMTB 1903 TaxID=1776680 RepID=UPI0007547D0F|nr:MafI family immunity protein [Streptomyces sp. IMTB 1903]